MISLVFAIEPRAGEKESSGSRATRLPAQQRPDPLPLTPSKPGRAWRARRMLHAHSAVLPANNTRLTRFKAMQHASYRMASVQFGS